MYDLKIVYAARKLSAFIQNGFYDAIPLRPGISLGVGPP
jgi:hypothetical protein